MNLFVTHPLPAMSAAYLDDKRVVNQLRETAQMLCTVLQELGCTASGLMAPTHQHHPVTRWVGMSQANWSWTLAHFNALAAEKAARWPTNPPHKNWLELHDRLPGLAWSYLKDLPRALVSFQNSARNESLGLDYSSTENVPSAYRNYLNARWKTDSRPPRWSNKEPPFWAERAAA